MSIFTLPQGEYPIGLDISVSSVKLLQLGAGKTGPKVRAYTSIQLPKGVIVEDSILDSQALSYVVSQGLDRPKYGRFMGSRVSASLPEAKSFIRVIHIQDMSDSEIDNAIPFEAESYIPIPIDQVYLDWEKLGVENGRLKILLVATPKDYIDKYLSSLDKMHFTPQSLEVESQSLARCLVKSSHKPHMLIGDINDHKTNLIMIESGRLNFSSSIPIGGNQFTDALSKHLGISYEKAERLKIEAGLKNTSEYPNLKQGLLKTLGNLAAEIKNVLKFQSEHSVITTQEILLCGGGAMLKEIAPNLSLSFTESQINVKLADPLVNLTGVTEETKLDNYTGLEYTTALGLALRSYQV